MKAWLMVALFIGFIACSALAADDPNKVPDQYAVRILKIQRDEATLQNQMLQLQQQFTADQTALTHDEAEITDVKQEALKAAKKDDTWDVDVNALTFIPRPKPAELKKDAPTK